EPARLLACIAAVLSSLPQRARARHMRHQRSGAQLAGAHRFRQWPRLQVLAEKRREMLRLPTRCGEVEYAVRRRGLPVPQAALELQHAALACGEEFAERCE